VQLGRRGHRLTGCGKLAAASVLVPRVRILASRVGLLVQGRRRGRLAVVLRRSGRGRRGEAVVVGRLRPGAVLRVVVVRHVAVPVPGVVVRRRVLRVLALVLMGRAPRMILVRLVVVVPVPGRRRGVVVCRRQLSLADRLDAAPA
jgi:hypothetical protein